MKQRTWALSTILGIGIWMTGCASSKAVEAFQPLKLPLDRKGNPDRSAIAWPVISADFLDPAYVNRLTAYETGPGVAVCEPSGASDAGSAAFGRGAARWLQLALSSQAALERMPTFTAVTRAIERGPVPFALTPAIAKRIHNCTGVTHAVTTRVTGNALTLRLYAIPEAKAVGGPIQLSGSQEQIAARLPSAVEQLVQALGAKAEGALPQTDSAAALRAIGNMPRKTTAEAGKIGKDILRLAQTSDLAALMAVEACSMSLRQDLAAEILAELPTRAKENPLLWASGGRAAVRLAFHSAPEEISGCMAMVKARPHHYLAKVAAAAMWACARQPAEAASYASEAVRCNPTSPESWRILAEHLAAQSETIRNGRAYRDLTAEELAGLQPLYRGQARAARKATEIDAAGFENWLILSSAATFAGDKETAEAALWRAIEISPLNYAVVDWGLTLYSSMWYDNPRMLRRVQEAASSKPLASAGDRAMVLAALQMHSRFDLVRKMKGAPAPRLATVPAPSAVEEPVDPEPKPRSASKAERVDLSARRKQLDEMADAALKSAGIGLDVFEPAAARAPAPAPVPLQGTSGVPPQAGRPLTAAGDETAPIAIENIGGTQTDGPPSRVLARTEQTLFALAWDSAGRHLAGAGRGGALFIVDNAGKRRDLRGHTGSVYSLTWSPNGASFASCGADGTIRVWDAVNGTQTAMLRGHQGPVRSVDWSARGVLASGGDDRTVRLWNVTGKSQLRKLGGHTQLVGGVAFSPDGSRLFTTAALVGAGEGIIWDAASGRQERKLDVAPGFLQSIAWSPDGKAVAVVKHKSVVVLDAAGGAQIEEFKPEAGYGPISLVWEAGCGLIVGIGNRKLVTIQPGTQPLPESISTGRSLPSAIAWNPSTKRLATAQNNGLVREWSPAPEGGTKP